MMPMPRQQSRLVRPRHQHGFKTPSVIHVQPGLTADSHPVCLAFPEYPRRLIAQAYSVSGLTSSAIPMKLVI